MSEYFKMQIMEIIGKNKTLHKDWRQQSGVEFEERKFLQDGENNKMLCRGDVEKHCICQPWVRL